MPTAAEGVFSLFLDNVETMLANSAEFRTWTGTASVAAAKLRIDWIDRDAGYTRPHALLTLVEWNQTKIAGGADASYSAEDVLVGIRFEGAVPTGDDEEDEARIFLNNVGNILEDLRTLSATGTYPVVRAFQMLENLQHSPRGERTSGGAAENYFSFTVGLVISAKG